MEIEDPGSVPTLEPAVFFARSCEDLDGSPRWQGLDDHLVASARQAAMFASWFDESQARMDFSCEVTPNELQGSTGSGPWGYLAGLWHDLGKFRPEFQRRIRGEKIAAEHSGVGAAFAARAGRAGQVLAFVIAGHHAGLANRAVSGPGFPTPLQERVKSSQALLPDIDAVIPHAIRSHSLPRLPEFLSGRQSPELTRRLEFWMRFLFSALVDADRLDSERFGNSTEALARTGFSDVRRHRDVLGAYIAEKVARLPADLANSPVNRARQTILADCMRHVEDPRGFFSLAAPTGGGKTLAGMSFALHHAAHHDLRRVIVVIPYTSIIEQNAAEYRRALGEGEVVEHHSNLDPLRRSQDCEDGEDLREELACENWAAPVIVTTTVQFFESLFSNRPGRCRKLHNIARSVIVLDEVQTLPPAFLNPILDGLTRLVEDFGCSVVLSTATPPALVARPGFSQGLTGVTPLLSDGEAIARTLERVEISWPGPTEPAFEIPALAAELVAEGRVLAIVHRRADARHLAMELVAMAPDEPIFHLSALMCPAHRSVILARIREVLATGQSCRVVSTQLVEAGVDLDFPVVWRAMAGLDAVVQAAGRCNREGRHERGRVRVFRLASRPPAGTPRRAAEITASLLEAHAGVLNPSNPNVFETFFRHLYGAENLDVANIQTLRTEFQFATVGREFRLIEDGFTRTIIVPYGDAPHRLDRVRRLGPDRNGLRALQPFTVSVYPDAFKKFEGVGAVEEVVPGLFALLPGYEAAYDDRFGLQAGDDPVADPNAFIL